MNALDRSTGDLQPVPELIVVDNNSSDDTRAVVERFREASFLRVKYLKESKQGLSFARNTGVREATSSIIAFTDDDCVPARNWITTIDGEFRGDPSLAILGGRVEPFENSDEGLGTRHLSERVQIDTYELLHTWMIGCNFAITRKAIDVLGPFDTGLGRGTLVDSGEDRDLLYRALKRGFNMVCSPDLLVYHGHGRHTEDAIESSRRSYARGRGAFYWKHISKGDPLILRMAFREIFYLIKKSFRVGRPLFGRTHNWTLLRNLAAGAAHRLRQNRHSKT